MSEKKLRKKYFSSFEWKPLILNFIVFVTMWIIWHYFIIWDYSYFNRIESFFMLGLCFFVRCLIFLGINWKESKWFLEEMKRIRR
jgi:hypothetical protein